MIFRLADKPAIDLSVIVAGSRPLVGPIAIGHVFAWEPYLPHARELALVVGLAAEGEVEEQLIHHATGTAVLTMRRGPGVLSISPFAGTAVWNDEGRFREACFRTTLKELPRR